MDSTPFPPIVHSKLNTGKEPFKCGMENAECGVRHNLISVIAKHRAPRQRFGRSAACPKPQRVRTNEPPGKLPASTGRHPLRVGTTRAPPNRPSGKHTGKKFPSTCI